MREKIQMFQQQILMVTIGSAVIMLVGKLSIVMSVKIFLTASLLSVVLNVMLQVIEKAVEVSRQLKPKIDKMVNKLTEPINRKITQLNQLINKLASKLVRRKVKGLMAREKLDEKRVLLELVWLVIGSAIATWAAAEEGALTPLLCVATYIGIFFAFAIYVVALESIARAFVEKFRNDAGEQ